MARYSDMSPAGVLTNLYSFGGGADGSYPAAALLQGSDGNFYGTTAYGGAYGDGTVFRMTPDGTLTTLVTFDGYAGANPQAALIEDADGSLLGTTQNGGADDAGVIFRLSFTGPPQITSQPASQSVYVGDNVMLSVAVSGASPFSYQWQKNGTNLVDGGNLSGSTSRVLSLTGVTTNDAGTYSVLVSNPAGATNSAAALLQVVSIAPMIVLVPTNQTPGACTAVSFSVAAVGNKPLSYLLAEEWGASSRLLQYLRHRERHAGHQQCLRRPIMAPIRSSSAMRSGSTNASASLTVVPASAPCTSLTTRHWFAGGSDGADPERAGLGHQWQSLRHDLFRRRSPLGHRLQPDHQRRLCDPRLRSWRRTGRIQPPRRCKARMASSMARLSTEAPLEPGTVYRHDCRWRAHHPLLVCRATVTGRGLPANWSRAPTVASTARPPPAAYLTSARCSASPRAGR